MWRFALLGVPSWLSVRYLILSQDGFKDLAGRSATRKSLGSKNRLARSWSSAKSRSSAKSGTGSAKSGTAASCFKIVVFWNRRRARCGAINILRVFLGGSAFCVVLGAIVRGLLEGGGSVLRRTGRYCASFARGRSALCRTGRYCTSKHLFCFLV